MDNTLYYGDNLAILRDHIKDESVDLIYLDPPFNSSRTYNLLFRQRKGDDSPAQIMAFEDTWTWSPILYEEFMQDIRNARLFDLMESLHKILGASEMMAYILMMAPRLVALHRTLRDTGSLWLHCDPVASHYLKVVLDVVFGPSSFRNEVIWKRSYGHGDVTRSMGRIHDTLLFYTATDKYKLNRFHHDRDEEYIAERFRHRDERGLHKQENLTSPNPRPNLTYSYKGYPPPAKGWRVSLEKMTQLDKEGRLYFPKDPNGRIMRKIYLDDVLGPAMTDLWTDIKLLSSFNKERLGYPTQKPLALLERIIGACSDEGDVVLDPFCGCGTAIVAADRLKRKWIGIDITYLAIAEIEYRLARETDAKPRVTYTVEGSPQDTYSARKFFEQTAPQNHKPFEMWAVSLVQGEPLEKKGGDKGIDGRIPIYDPKGKLQWAVIQVKGGHLSPTLIRDFAHVIGRDKAIFGLFICLNTPTKQMLQEAQELGMVAGFGARQIQRLQILTIDDLLEHEKRFDLPIGYMPVRNKGIGKVAHKTQEMDFSGEEGEEEG